MTEQLSGYVDIRDAGKHLYDAKPTVSSQWQITPRSGEYSTKVGDASQYSSHTSTLEKMGKPF